MNKWMSAFSLFATFFSITFQAQEIGRVISSFPIIQQVAVPRQVCSQQQVTTQPHKSGAGAVMGAIAGGTVGHAIGRDALGTAIGMFGGAILGDKIEGNPNPHLRNVQRCTQHMVYDSRITGYNVVYEFAGKQYSAMMPTNPGPVVQLQITPLAPPVSYSGSPQAVYPATPSPYGSAANPPPQSTPYGAGSSMVPPPNSAPQSYPTPPGALSAPVPLNN